MLKHAIDAPTRQKKSHWYPRVFWPLGLPFLWAPDTRQCSAEHAYRKSASAFYDGKGGGGKAAMADITVADL